MHEGFIEFLKNSPTAYHACETIQARLEENGFVQILETEDWAIHEGGKYFLIRGGSLIAFTVGSLDEFAYKLVASHTDSCALKLKDDPIVKSGGCVTLNTEKYGGAMLYTFLDKPLRIAGRVVKRTGSVLKEETVLSPFLLTIPSLAIHQNRTVNDSLAVNPQIDLMPLTALVDENFSMDEILKKLTDGNVISYDLYLVNADMPHTFGVHNEFLSAPRLDNLVSVYTSIEALITAPESSGINLVACMEKEEIGSTNAQGADGDFMENTLRRIAYALRFDENEYYKALASSFLLSVDNAHAVHPNHPEKSDPTNKCVLGGGIVIKSHAGGAYITDAVSSAVVRTILDNAEIKHQNFFNRSDVKSGSTLGVFCQRHASMHGADIGIAQLAMHSATECIAWKDFEALQEGLKAYLASTLRIANKSVTIE